MKRKLVLLGVWAIGFVLITAADSLARVVRFTVLDNACKITWNRKEHAFLPNIHLYIFRGEFAVRFCHKSEGDDHGAACTHPVDTMYYEFEAFAQYRLYDNVFSESITIRQPRPFSFMMMNDQEDTARCSDPNSACSSNYVTVEHSGHSPFDPWISQEQSAVAVESAVYGGTMSMSEFEPLGVLPPGMLSLCAYSAAERAALAPELVDVGTCVSYQAAQTPDTFFSLLGTPFKGHFANPSDAFIGLVVHCLPCAIEATGCNLFYVDLDKKVWDGNVHGYIWIEIKRDKLADIARNPSQKTGYAVVNLGLNEPGIYRVRGKSALKVFELPPDCGQYFTSERCSPISSCPASAYTPWTQFTAGTLPQEFVDQVKAAGETLPSSGAAGAVRGRKPDLVVAQFKENADVDQSRHAWLVRNVGDKSAPATELDVCCKAIGAGDCPASFGASDAGGRRCHVIGIDEELYPKPGGAPGEPLGGTWRLIPLLPLDGGTYRLSAKVDPRGLIEELSESNNEKLVDYPGPPLAGKLHADQDGLPASADLACQFRLEESATQGRYTLSLTVRNQGTEPSADTAFTLACERVGGGACPSWFHESYPLRALDPEESYVVAASDVILPPPGVKFKLTAVVDPQGKVFEGLHEGNNTAVAYVSSLAAMEELSAGSIVLEALPRQEGSGGLISKGKRITEAAREGSDSGYENLAIKLDVKGRGLAGKADAAGSVKLRVQRMWTVPAALKAGEPFALNLSVVNQGNAPGGMGDLLQVICSTLEGGPCPTLGVPPRLGAALGAKGVQTLKMDNLRLHPGRYRLTAHPVSAPEGKLSLELTVNPGRLPASAAGAAPGQLGGAADGAPVGSGDAAVRARKAIPRP